MSPRVAKADREDPPKSIVQFGTVGGFPLTGKMLSYRAGDYLDILIGVKDAHETLYHREHSILDIQQDNGTKTFDLTGSLFNGMSDAFYRGKLPEVLLIAPSVSELDEFLEGLLEHLDKLGALGFFVPTQTSEETALLQSLIPIFVLASNGVFYTGFCQKLAERLTHVPALSASMRQKMMEHILRGVFSHEEDWDPSLGASIPKTEPTPLCLAGGSITTQQTVRSVLSNKRFQIRIKERGALPAERIELQHALYRLNACILPALNQLGERSLDEMKEDQIILPKALLDIGKKRNVFEEKDSLSRLLAEVSAGGENNDPMLRWGDSTVFRYLLRYADGEAWEKEKQRFWELKQKVLHQLKLKQRKEK